MRGEPEHDDHNDGGLPLGEGAVPARVPRRRAQAAPTQPVGLVNAIHDDPPAVSGELLPCSPGSGRPTGSRTTGCGSSGGGGGGGGSGGGGGCV